MKLPLRHVSLFLTGGLGNQLFQFAVALAFAEGRSIRVYDEIGSPRKNEFGDPDIYSFNLEKIVEISRNSKSSWLAGKSSGYLLRSNIWPRSLEKSSLYRLATRFFSGVLGSILLRDALCPVTISSVGYEEIKLNKLASRFLNPYFIGYFQTYIWPERVRSLLLELEIKSKGPELILLEALARKKAPIIIHIRRGDYKTESSFGLPGIEYYINALKFLDAAFADHPIWVFSDEEEEAKKILEWAPKNRIKFIFDVDGSSAASLEAMRLGCAYIIANSTFSWWGAFLSKSKDPKIVAPKPWFTGQAEPSLLIPNNWVRFDQQ